MQTGQSPGGEVAAVLLVEAAAVGRQAVRERLAAEGYQVLEAANADAATRILAARDDIVVVVTDVDLPGPMSGAELAQLLARQAPWISVVATSATALADRRGFGLLTRPYSPESLVQMVRAAAAAALHLRRTAASGRAR